MIDPIASRILFAAKADKEKPGESVAVVLVVDINLPVETSPARAVKYIKGVPKKTIFLN